VRQESHSLRPALLEVKGITKRYNKAAAALDDVSFSVGKGEFISVIGPSGAGKSTLLRCINRMVEVSEGEVHFDGISVGKLNKTDLKKLRSKIGMIFQHYNLVDRLTVIENITR
jgi:phosphonate transport system ATP-binding protein